MADDRCAAPYRVLSLDGGGVRGLYSAVLLRQLAGRLASRRNRSCGGEFDIGGAFDLIAGTSTGSILGIALAAGVPLERVISMYRNESGRIFQRPKPSPNGRDWFGYLSLAAWVARCWASPANESEALRAALESVLGDETLGQLYQRRRIALCVPTINATTERAWVFKTPHAPRLRRDTDCPLVDVCMASAAAPIYFPVHGLEIPDPSTTVPNWYVDGGLWANNPVLVALVEALEMAPPDVPIEILSVGTCSPTPANSIGRQGSKRGVWAWKGGASVVTMSQEAQAFAMPYMASVISKATRRVTLYRLEDAKISSSQSTHLALDSVDSKSLDTLESLARIATDENISTLTNAQAGTPESDMVLGMFSNLTPLISEVQ